MIVRAYAVVCKTGEVHQDDEHSYVFLDRDQAKDEKADLAGECGPHRVVSLRGECVPWARP